MEDAFSLLILSLILHPSALFPEQPGRRSPPRRSERSPTVKLLPERPTQWSLNPASYLLQPKEGRAAADSRKPTVNGGTPSMV